MVSILRRSNKWNRIKYLVRTRSKISFGVQSSLYLCSHELRQNETQISLDFISLVLTGIKFQTGMRFSCKQNLPEAKQISADSLDIAFNEHVHLKLIAGVISLRSFWQKWNLIIVAEISSKRYTKCNTYPANIHLDEDALKTSWRRLSSPSSEDVLIKTNMFALALRLQDDLVETNIFVLAIRFQNVFKTSSRRFSKTSSRHFQDVFKTSSKRLHMIKLNCSC